MILKSLGIQMDLVDISAPGMDDQRDMMRASAKKKEGQRHALPPQIFNGEKYCGVGYFFTMIDVFRYNDLTYTLLKGL